MKKLNKALLNKETELIMYLYDGFLFDYSSFDGEFLLDEIFNILSDSRKFKTKRFEGENFGKMAKID
jgi:hypothetical protein